MSPFDLIFRSSLNALVRRDAEGFPITVVFPYMLIIFLAFHMDSRAENATASTRLNFPQKTPNNQP